MSILGEVLKEVYRIGSHGYKPTGRECYRLCTRDYEMMKAEMELMCRYNFPKSEPVTHGIYVLGIRVLEDPEAPPIVPTCRELLG